MQNDYALSQLVSLGIRFNYLFSQESHNHKSEISVVKFKAVGSFLENYKAGLFVRFHLGPTFKIADKVNPFLGIDASFKVLMSSIS